MPRSYSIDGRFVLSDLQKIIDRATYLTENIVKEGNVNEQVLARISAAKFALAEAVGLVKTK